MSKSAESNLSAVSLPSASSRELLLLAGAVLTGVFIVLLSIWLPRTVVVVLMGGIVGLTAGFAALGLWRLRNTSHALDTAIKSLGRKFDRTSSKLEHRLENELLQVKADAERQASATRSLTNRTDKITERIEELSADAESRLQTVRQDIARGAKTASDSNDSLRRRLVVAHRLSALSRAYDASSFEFPRRLVLLMTVERSGSTALFDLVRSHPRVYFEPLSFIWEELGLTGRRYPTSLSDTGRYTEPVEVQPGIGALIPAIVDSHHEDRAVAIEKGHPQFIDHDVGALRAGIERVEGRGTDVNLIIQTRNPLDAMWSIAEYKAREPTWYSNLEVTEIPEYVLSSFRSLESFATIEGSALVDHREMQELSTGFVQLVEQLGPVPGETTAWITSTFERLRKQQHETRFSTPEINHRTAAGPNDLWLGSADVVGEAEAIWARLVSPDATRRV